MYEVINESMISAFLVASNPYSVIKFTKSTVQLSASLVKCSSLMVNSLFYPIDWLNPPCSVWLTVILLQYIPMISDQIPWKIPLTSILMGKSPHCPLRFFSVLACTPPLWDLLHWALRTPQFSIEWRFLMELLCEKGWHWIPSGKLT